MSKLKPVAGPDDLLLLLVQHWARDEHVFPTEDDRHDVATILLFRSYTSGRSTKFVYFSKGKASEDPLGEAEATNKHRERGDKHDAKGANTGDSLEYDDDSDAGGGPEYDDDIVFDSNDDEDPNEDDLSDESTRESAERDSGYSSDGTDNAITKDTNCYTVEIDGVGQLVCQNNDAAEWL